MGIKGHDLYLTVVPLLGKVYTDSVIQSVSLKNSFAFGVKDYKNRYNSKPIYQFLKGFLIFISLYEDNIFIY